MPTVKVPLFTRSYTSIDDTVLTDDAAIQYNGFVDELEGLNIRPGEVLALNTAKRIDGMFVWPDKNFVVCAEEGAMALRTVSGEILNTSFVGPLTFPASNIVTFCTDGPRVFMAGGGKINYVDEFGVVTELADVDAPTKVTHVAFLDGYILAIDGLSGKFHWSDIPTNTDWSALNFATAEGSPDNTISLAVVQRQIYLLGTASVEIWENNGSDPFSRIPGGLIEVGCGAKYSPIRRDNSLLWLTNKRQIVEFTGTGLEYISSRYDRELANLTVVDDCIGALIVKDGQEFCVFQFPAEQRTIVYDPTAKDWSEWGNWDENGMSWIPYDIRASAYDYRSGKTLVGKSNAKVIACLSSDSRVDLIGGSTTRPFKFLRRTGNIDHGTNKIKRVEELTFRVKRGSASSYSSPKLMLRYRNNGSSQWSNLKEIDLGATGNTSHHVKLNRLGMFKSRQYEISVTDNVPLVFSKAESDVTVLR
jgi:hypothetical protein